MSEIEPFRYLALGQPPRQPRSTVFEPKNWRRKPVKLGRAEIVSPCGAKPEIPLNEDILELYDVSMASERPVKAGEVIIAAKPFVKVPCTR